MAETSLKRLARAIKALTFDDTQDMAIRLKNIVEGREDDDEYRFDKTSLHSWMDLIQGWANAELDD